MKTLSYIDFSQGLAVFLFFGDQDVKVASGIQLKPIVMLKWTATFLVIALVAALLGFTDIASGAASIAQVIFFIFLIFFVGSIILGATIFKRS